MSISETNPFRIIGACAPSSRRLADAITHYVTRHDGDRILEVGAGSGAITHTLIRKMRPSQISDIVEIFPRLAAFLRMRFSNQRGIHIYDGDILHFKCPPNTYDLILCSLPFNAFPPKTTFDILSHLVDLAKDGAIMSYFEYRCLHGMAKILLTKKRLEQFQGSRQLIEQFNQRYKFRETVVNFNLPPAVVHYLRIDKSLF